MIDDAASNVGNREEASSDTESLDEETRPKLAVLPMPKFCATRKGFTSNLIDQMTLLEQTCPQRLKQDPETKYDCYARVRNY